MEMLITIFLIIAAAYACIVPGYSKKRGAFVGVKVMISITIGYLVIACNFGQEWDVGGVETTVPYHDGLRIETNASLRVKIGLRSVNVTLQGKTNEAAGTEAAATERIDYNERFWWTWDQGRYGFGPNGGLLQRMFRDAQIRGTPISILWVVEYLTIDGGGIRLGRYYRTAGWYCHILMWGAFAGWLLALILLQSTGRHAAYAIVATGSLQLLACLIWFCVRNPTPLTIPFQNDILTLSFGKHFWMTFLSGSVCLALGGVILLMDLRYPDSLSEFLGMNPLDEYDECMMRASEYGSIQKTDKNVSNDVELATRDTDGREGPSNVGMVVFKRRSTMKNAQKSLLRPTVPVIMGGAEQSNAVIYENTAVVK